MAGWCPAHPMTGMDREGSSGGGPSPNFNLNLYVHLHPHLNPHNSAFHQFTALPFKLPSRLIHRSLVLGVTRVGVAGVGDDFRQLPRNLRRPLGRYGLFRESQPEELLRLPNCRLESGVSGI
ncbi:hypothetical protein [Desulfobacca acetoxidans]